MNEHKVNLEDLENGQEVAKQSGQASQSRFHVDYWKDRLFKKTYTRDGKRHEVPEWSVRLQHLGQREAFALGTANASAAATKAKDIATFLEANGWDATLAKYKPSPLAKADVCSLGAFLAEVETRSGLHPRTARIYATKLRKIFVDVAKLNKGLKGKAARAKYDYVNGGRLTWLAKIDGQRLDVLTPDALTTWRNDYVSKAGSDPMKRKSAERSAASILRAGRALFAKDVVDTLRVKLPPNPFVGVKVKDPGPQRYHSEVNPELMLLAAERELRAAHPQQYLALILCLCAGLRRKEADLLLWEQVDFTERTIYVRRTPYFEPKTDESQRVIDLPQDVVDVIRSYKSTSSSAFVMNGADANPEASYGYYRCDCTWRFLIAWLKKKGVKQRTAIHTLRKESGSLIASEYGIEAARQHLGHRDISTTSAHYVGKKKRIEVGLSINSIAISKAVGDEP